MRLRRVMLPVLAGVALSSNVALASPQARLVYGRVDGASSCPDESALRHAVAARIGYDPFFPSAPRTVVVTIGARGALLVARVQLIDDDAHAQGARELESKGRDCASLFDTVALTVSIAIDPQGLTHPSPPAPPPPSSPASPPSPVAPMAPLPSSEPETLAPDPVPGKEADAQISSSTVWARPRAGAVVRSTSGLAPAPTLGLSVLGGATWKHLSIDGEAALDLPASEETGDGARVRGWLLAGALVPCLRAAPLAFCALVTAGRFEGSATHVIGQTSQAAFFFAAGARMAADLALSRTVALEGRLDGLVNVEPAQLVVGVTREWTATRIAGVLSVGPVMSF